MGVLNRHHKTISLIVLFLVISVPILLWINRPQFVIDNKSYLSKGKSLMKQLDLSMHTNKKNTKSISTAYVPFSPLPPIRSLYDIGALLYKENKKIAIQVNVDNQFLFKEVLRGWHTVDIITIIEQQTYMSKSGKDDDMLPLNLKKLDNYKDRIHICQDSESPPCVKKYLDSTVDFIFLIAKNHHLIIVNDMSDWWPKLKTGGIMCGPSYFTRSSILVSEDKQRRNPKPHSTANTNIKPTINGFYSRMKKTYKSNVVNVTEVSLAINEFSKQVSRQVQLTFDEVDVAWCLRK